MARPTLVQKNARRRTRFQCHHGIRAERVVIVNRQVGIFADLDGADALVDSELDGGIQRDHFQCFIV